ncbi:MAG: LuxR C-terminal-related transcriptional regulator [Pseudomonadota bacterium]
MDRGLLEAARKIETAVKIERLWDIYTEALHPYGIDQALYMTDSDGPPSEPFVISTLPDNWPAALLADPEFVEPFLNYCCATFEITKAGIEFLPDHDTYLDEANKLYIQQMTKFEWRAALGIPCRLVGTGRRGGFIIGNNLDGFTFERKILPLAPMLQSFCLIAHRRIEAIQNQDLAGNGQKPLSAREHQTISLIAKGLRPKQIAHELGVSEASVRLYLKNARMKLGADTKEEAVARFLSQNPR